ncbi:MAG: molybdopterin guanine dinucleotide synthesis [Pseudomonadota bacterium]
MTLLLSPISFLPRSTLTFDAFLMVDWSGGNDRGLTPKKDAIWACVARAGVPEAPIYFRNRRVAEAWITLFLAQEHQGGCRVLAGFDFAFGYPMGFGKVLTGSDDPFAVWDWFAARVEDTPKANNRFDLAGQINAMFPGVGPFWGNGLKREIADLPRKGKARHGHGMTEKRAAEEAAKGAFPVWQLSGAGAVGSQVIMGLPMLARLRARFNGDIAVWPFEPLHAPLAIVEIWPSLIADAVAATQTPGQIKDAHQVSLLAETLSALPTQQLARMLDQPINAEGSILGLHDRDVLAEAARTKAS